MDFKQNLTDRDQRPVLRTYLNIVRYLNDYYLYRRRKDPSFSYELWAAELGFKAKPLCV